MARIAEELTHNSVFASNLDIGLQFAAYLARARPRPFDQSTFFDCGSFVRGLHKTEFAVQRADANAPLKPSMYDLRCVFDRRSLAARHTHATLPKTEVDSVGVSAEALNTADVVARRDHAGTSQGRGRTEPLQRVGEFTL